MSRSVTMPTSRRPSHTGRTPTFISSMIRAASRTVRSGWITRTSRVITSAILIGFLPSRGAAQAPTFPAGAPVGSEDQCGGVRKVRRGRTRALDLEPALPGLRHMSIDAGGVRKVLRGRTRDRTLFRGHDLDVAVEAALDLELARMDLSLVARDQHVF